MSNATNHTFEVQEQSLYRALRRFKGMKMVDLVQEESPSGGPKRKVYHLTPVGVETLRRFIDLHISPLVQDPIHHLITRISERTPEL